MLRKYTLIASVLIVFGTPFNVQAQTMDIAMKIQTILDQFSEIRSQLKQIQSSMNIETMMQNLGGSGDWKAMLQNAGGIFDRNADKGGTKQTLLVLPDGLAQKADDPDAAIGWIEKNMYIQSDKPSLDEQSAMASKRKEFKFTSLISAYGKALSTRRQLDKDLETVEKLKQDAQSKDSETDLQNEINRLALLKLEQANYEQLLRSTRSQIEGVYSIMPANDQAADLMRGK